MMLRRLNGCQLINKNNILFRGPGGVRWRRFTAGGEGGQIKFVFVLSFSEREREFTADCAVGRVKAAVACKTFQLNLH